MQPSNMRKHLISRFEQYKFSPIIEVSKESIIITNEEFEILYWNKASSNIFGFAKNEAIGQPLNILIPNNKEDQYRSQLIELFLKDENKNEATVTEINLQKKNGSIFPVELSISSWIEDGEKYIFGIIRDITIRKRIEKENIGLRQIINKTPSCVKMVNRKGLLIDMNNVGLKIIEADSLDTVYMQNIYSLIHEEDRDRYKKFNEFICDGGEGNLIFKIKDLKGNIKFMETFARPNELENGELVHLAITLDITERINSERALNEKNEELEEAKRLSVVGEFAAGIAHEVNNPLAVIHSRSQLLELQINNLNVENEEDKKSLRESLNTIKETVELTSDLIKNLKTFSGKVHLEKMEMITLKESVDMALKLVRKRCVNDNIQLLTDIDEDVKFVCNSAGLGQVLLNLITNSMDAIKDKKEKWIRISSTLSEKKVKISVTDSGNGIPEKIAKKITQPFFTTKDPGEGTGLGLSISLKLVKKMGGTLIYNPKAKNTQFEITFNSAAK